MHNANIMSIVWNFLNCRIRRSEILAGCREYVMIPFTYKIKNYFDIQVTNL